MVLMTLMRAPEFHKDAIGGRTNFYFLLTIWLLYFNQNTHLKFADDLKIFRPITYRDLIHGWCLNNKIRFIGLNFLILLKIPSPQLKTWVILLYCLSIAQC